MAQGAVSQQVIGRTDIEELPSGRLLAAQNNRYHLARAKNGERTASLVKTGEHALKKFLDRSRAFGVNLRNRIADPQPTGIGEARRIDLVDLKSSANRLYRDPQNTC